MRNAVEVALEVADHAVHNEPRKFIDQRGGTIAHNRLGQVNRDVSAKHADLAQGLEQDARLGCRPRPEFDQLGRARDASDLASRLFQISRSTRVG